MISLFMSKWMAKKTTGTELIDPNAPRNQAEAWLLNEVAQLAQRSGINMPEVGIFPSYQSNAFATGWNKNDALVAVSTGLLERMNKDELRAVLAHEIGHVAFLSLSACCCASRSSSSRHRQPAGRGSPDVRSR